MTSYTESNLRMFADTITRTENGMATNATTFDANVNLFFKIGSARGMAVENFIHQLFQPAFVENPELALRILFWSRDCRMGAGERKNFRETYVWLSQNYPNIINQNLHLIPELGRWDDLWDVQDNVWPRLAKSTRGHILNLVQTSYLNSIRTDNPEKPDNLMCKWLPTKGHFFNSLVKYIGNAVSGFNRSFNAGDLRRWIVKNRKTVETSMCSNQWDDINYSHVPSQAFKRYNKSFRRHDEYRFDEFINQATRGEAKINTSVLYPHDIIKPLLQSIHYNVDDSPKVQEVNRVAEAQWSQLANNLTITEQVILPVCDVSGSMYSQAGSLKPIDVAVSLSLYLAEHNTGVFENKFITFSAQPNFIELGANDSLYEKVQTISHAEWGMNTNLEAVFELILDAAVTYEVPAENMPTMLIILSDMEFDRSVSHANDTAIDMIERRYRAAGYKRPQVVFWNLNSQNINNYPVTRWTKDTALISGFNTNILRDLLSGVELTPYNIMINTVNKERYQVVI